MKLSLALITTVLAGLTMASPVPEAADTEAQLDAQIQAFGQSIGTQALDGNCVRCVSRGCGAAGVRCLNRLNPWAITACLALTCGDDVFKCCVF